MRRTAICPSASRAFRITALAAACLFVALTAWLAFSAGSASSTGGGPEMRLTLTWGGGLCTAGACDVGTGETFSLAVEIVEAPAPGYVLAQSWVEYGDQLVYSPAITTAAVEIVWPDCAAVTALRTTPSATGVGHGCLTGLVSPLPVSAYVGNFVWLSMNCPSSEVSVLVRLLALDEPPADTIGSAFVDSADQHITPKTTDVTINCIAGLTPPPTLTPIATPTLAPGETPPPTATLAPGETPAPTATLVPGETPLPTATLAPGETPPTATLAPGETPAPTSTLAPGETPAPTATLAPGETPLPTSTPAPGATATPTPVSTPAPGEPAGDANCDGAVDPVDSVFILQWWAGLLAALPCSGDANADGATTVVDAALILQFTAGLVSTLPP